MQDLQTLHTEQPKHAYFEHLDVIRFLAAFIIVIAHAYEAWCGWYGQIGILSAGTYKELSYFGKFIDTFIRNFGIGVDIFFLLSGFLITYILLEEKKRYNKISIGKFMIRRALRIWPLYFLLIAAAPFFVHITNSPQPNYLANVFFLGNFDTIHSQTWGYPFAHFWSICIEEHFYLVWPFIIAFIPKKRLIQTFIIVILISISFRLIFAMTHSFSWFTLYANTLSRIDVLVIGAIGAYFYSEKPFTLKLSRFVRYTLLISILISLFIEPVVLWDTLFMASFKKYFYISIIAVLLLDFNFNPYFKHVFKPGSIFHYFGKVSYGIYMYGNVILLIIIKKMLIKWGISNIYIFFSLIFFLSILIPVVSYELYEKHFLKLARKFRNIKSESSI